MAKLITENTIRDYKVIREAKENGPETLIIEGVYIQSDEKNGNGRSYSYEMMKPVVDKFIEEKVSKNLALEELEHPQEVVINPDRVCCRTIALKENTRDRSWIGRSVVLASDPKYGIKGTPCGDIVKSLLQYDVKLGHSTRGVGEVDESSGEVSQFQLICIDTVMNPSIGVYNDSNGNRFVNGILESKDFVINEHGEIYERKFNRLEKDLTSLSVDRTARNEKVFKAVQTFLNSLR